MIDLDGAHRLTQFNPLITSREMNVPKDSDLVSKFQSLMYILLNATVTCRTLKRPKAKGARLMIVHISLSSPENYFFFKETQYLVVQIPRK